VTGPVQIFKMQYKVSLSKLAGDISCAIMGDKGAVAAELAGEITFVDVELVLLQLPQILLALCH